MQTKQKRDTNKHMDKSKIRRGRESDEQTEGEPHAPLAHHCLIAEAQQKHIQTQLQLQLQQQQQNKAPVSSREEADPSRPLSGTSSIPQSKRGSLSSVAAPTNRSLSGSGGGGTGSGAGSSSLGGSGSPGAPGAPGAPSADPALQMQQLMAMYSQMLASMQLGQTLPSSSADPSNARSAAQKNNKGGNKVQKLAKSSYSSSSSTSTTTLHPSASASASFAQNSAAAAVPAFPLIFAVPSSRKTIVVSDSSAIPSSTTNASKSLNSQSSSPSKAAAHLAFTYGEGEYQSEEEEDMLIDAETGDDGGEETAVLPSEPPIPEDGSGSDSLPYASDEAGLAQKLQRGNSAVRFLDTVSPPFHSFHANVARGEVPGFSSTPMQMFNSNYSSSSNGPAQPYSTATSLTSSFSQPHIPTSRYERQRVFGALSSLGQGIPSIGDERQFALSLAAYEEALETLLGVTLEEEEALSSPKKKVSLQKKSNSSSSLGVGMETDSSEMSPVPGSTVKLSSKEKEMRQEERSLVQSALQQIFLEQQQQTRPNTAHGSASVSSARNRDPRESLQHLMSINPNVGTPRIRASPKYVPSHMSSARNETSLNGKVSPSPASASGNSKQSGKMKMSASAPVLPRAGSPNASSSSNGLPPVSHSASPSLLASSLLYSVLRSDVAETYVSASLDREQHLRERKSRPVTSKSRSPSSSSGRAKRINSATGARIMKPPVAFS
eukprot:GILI01003789.1.p1 GENE.GILI01003789.1~~GILI01003789.1.p1  ORF type:complete len:719 (-),score=204.35 GILI01003789.1:712-2868(-)